MKNLSNEQIQQLSEDDYDDYLDSGYDRVREKAIEDIMKEGLDLISKRLDQIEGESGLFWDVLFAQELYGDFYSAVEMGVGGQRVIDLEKIK